MAYEITRIPYAYDGLVTKLSMRDNALTPR